MSVCLQSECVCKTGYMGNGIVCDLINPCLRQNGGCHQLVNTHTRTHARTHTLIHVMSATKKDLVIVTLTV